VEDRSVLERVSAVPEQRVFAESQVADVYVGSAALPLLVLVHGGYWRPEYDRTHLRPMSQAFHTLGYSVVSLEYERTPGDPDAAVADVMRGLTWPWDVPGTGRIGIGHSAGGHLLLTAIAQHPIELTAAICLAPVANFARAHELGLDDNAARDFAGDRIDLDPCTLPLPRTPVEILHGERDTLVPIELSEHYVRRHGILHRLAEGTHFSLIDPQSPEWTAVTAVVSRHSVAEDSKE
jgi:acetyl esterase/lipase